MPTQSELDSRLEKALSLRDRLAAKAQKLAGKKEAAEKALQDVEDEIRSKNLDPDDLQETIDRLKEAYEKSVSSFEDEVQSFHKKLEPYLESDP